MPSTGVLSHRFPRSRRLRRRREFLAVQGSGNKVHGRYFLVIFRGGTGRLGIAVSKKVGNAVKRNRIKRLVREFVRTSEWLPSDCDAVVIAKRNAVSVRGLADVARDLSRMRSRLGSC